ncbi:MAG: hypothetical protein KKD69_01855 [Euryarchaeota archaeon]|nr:hypothetical protein [Euryarchaeota archaeon]MBU4491186.1 hypothetical protein [Euryarchaeota archaeon]
MRENRRGCRGNSEYHDKPGRTFVYTQRAIAKNGRYELKVPYSTRGYKYGTKSIGDYTVNLCEKYMQSILN